MRPIIERLPRNRVAISFQPPVILGALVLSTGASGNPLWVIHTPQLKMSIDASFSPVIAGMHAQVRKGEFVSFGDDADLGGTLIERVVIGEVPAGYVESLRDRDMENKLEISGILVVALFGKPSGVLELHLR